MKKLRKTICFAYYGDGKFIGWYADSFGSIRRTPKIYGNSKGQLKVIESNFKSKLKRLTDKIQLNVEEIITSHNDVAGALLKSGLNGDEKILQEYSVIELKIVKCPHYDGPNPHYSNKIHKAFRKNYTKLYHKWCKEMKLDPGIEKGTNFGIGLIENYKLFKKSYPPINSKNWVHVDYNKIVEWASKEPLKAKSFVKLKIKEINEARTS